MSRTVIESRRLLIFLGTIVCKQTKGIVKETEASSDPLLTPILLAGPGNSLCPLRGIKTDTTNVILIRLLIRLRF